MERATKIEATYSEVISAAVDRFGDHENMSRARVIRWLSQFADEDLPAAVSLLQNITYYGPSNIRSLARNLVEIIIPDLASLRMEKIAFVPVGEAGSGSSILMRVVKDLRLPSPIRRMSKLHLHEIKPGELDAIVFLDDFSGTGRTLEKWWANVEPLVRPIGAAVIVGLLVLNYKAREPIERFADRLYAPIELDEGYNVLSIESSRLTQEEKEAAASYCAKTGAGGEYIYGLGECGLLVAFNHGCPNNSLPILWYDAANWRTLFNRRAI